MTTPSTLPDLASRTLSGGVVHANDEFFAPADHLVDPNPPTFAPHTFGAKGQLYDGWETRRRRTPGHDHAIVRLGVPGIVRTIVIDTSHFTGNYPPYAAVDGCRVDGHPAPEELADATWVSLVPRVALSGDTRNVFPVDPGRRVTHVRLSVFPDGGVARLRVHGEVTPDPRFLTGGLVDLAALENGGLVVDCSNMFYGAPNNLIAPGRAGTMGEGWETARRRDDDNDWVLVRLGAPGVIRVAEVDTSHFKGNAPGAAALRASATDPEDPSGWADLLPMTRLQPDTRHRFLTADVGAVTWVRLDVYPDGGMARLRLLGEITPAGLATLRQRWSTE